MSSKVLVPTKRLRKNLLWVSTGCWEYLGVRNNKGYGNHRRVYERLVGPIPEGMELDHLCRNRGCSNPAHMEVVTVHENRMRAFSANQQKTRCPKGHEYTAENTYIEKKANGLTCRRCKTCRSVNRKRRRNAQQL